MNYGLQIGKKFDRSGKPKRYPGNTVIADVEPENPAYAIIHHVKELLSVKELENCFIFLPEDSYHVTIIRGMNDLVREDAFWPSALAKDAPMEVVDDYLEEALVGIPVPKDIYMCFDHIQIDDHDVRVCLRPRDEVVKQKLCQYRDAVADRLGLRLPGHDRYTYHATVAYMLYLPEGEQRECLKQLEKEIDTYLGQQGELYLTAPRIAFYDDMLNFYQQRIPRDHELVIQEVS